MGEHTEGKSESLSLVESVLFFFFLLLSKLFPLKNVIVIFRKVRVLKIKGKK